MRTAWVTGGGTGIGRALAKALYREGYRVAISGRRAEVLAESVREISQKSGPGEIISLPGDVSRPEDVRSMAEGLKSHSIVPDLLVNNAGSNSYHRYQETTSEEFRKALETNCLSATYCINAVLPAMREAGGGAIVNVSSVLGKWGSCGSAAYSVSKYAMTGLTDVLRQEFSSASIHVMGVFPGFIRTAMTDPFVHPGSLKARFGATPESMAQAILQGLRRRQAEVHFPWYVPWFLRIHRVFPKWSDHLAGRLRR